MQSLSGHYLMRQQVPMVFLLLLVYLGTIAYISVEINLGSCWRRDILRVKGQALFTNREFARRGTHLYAHDFDPLFGFLFVLRGMEKNNKTCCYFRFTS